MDWLITIIAMLLGGVVGVLIMKRTYPAKNIGTLRIDTSDSDGPYLFLELDQSVGEIYNEKYVRLRVSTESYLSQK